MNLNTVRATILNRKTIALMILLFALSACGIGGANQPAGEPAPTAATGGVPDGLASAYFIDLLVNGTYSYDFVEVDETPGGRFTGVGSVAADGGKYMRREEITVVSYVNDVRSTIQSYNITRDGKTYSINNERKTVLEMSSTDEFVIGKGGIEYIGSDTGWISGRLLPYEEYIIDGSSTKYFLDGGTVYGFIRDSGAIKPEVVMSNISDSLPEGVFDLPADYEYSTLDDLIESSRKRRVDELLGRDNETD